MSEDNVESTQGLSFKQTRERGVEVADFREPEPDEVFMHALIRPGTEPFVLSSIAAGGGEIKSTSLLTQAERKQNQLEAGAGKEIGGNPLEINTTKVTTDKTELYGRGDVAFIFTGEELRKHGAVVTERNVHPGIVNRFSPEGIAIGAAIPLESSYIAVKADMDPARLVRIMESVGLAIEGRIPDRTAWLQNRILLYKTNEDLQCGVGALIDKQQSLLDHNTTVLQRMVDKKTQAFPKEARVHDHTKAEDVPLDQFAVEPDAQILVQGEVVQADIGDDVSRLNALSEVVPTASNLSANFQQSVETASQSLEGLKTALQENGGV